MNITILFAFGSALITGPVPQQSPSSYSDNNSSSLFQEYEKKFYLNFSRSYFDFNLLVNDYRQGGFRNLGEWLAKLYRADPMMFRYPIFNFLTRAPQHPPRVFFISSNGKLALSIGLSKSSDPVDVIHVEHTLNTVPVMRPHELLFGALTPMNKVNPPECHNCHGASSRDERMFTYRWDGYDSWPRMIGSVLDEEPFPDDQPKKENELFIALLKQNAKSPALQFTFREWQIDPTRFESREYLVNAAKKLHLESNKVSQNRTTIALMVWNFRRMAGIIRSHPQYPKYSAAILRSLNPARKWADEEFVEEKDFNTKTFPATDIAALFGSAGSLAHTEFLNRYEKRFTQIAAMEKRRAKDFQKINEYLSGGSSSPSLHIVPAARLATVLSYMNIEFGHLSTSTQFPSYDFSTPLFGLTDEFLSFLTSNEAYIPNPKPIIFQRQSGEEILKANCAQCHSDITGVRGPFIKDWKDIDTKKLHRLLTTDMVESWMPKGYARLAKDQVDAIMSYVEYLQCHSASRNGPQCSPNPFAK